MTDEQQVSTNEQETEQLQAGTLLKRKREELGLSQKQIADRLRLRPSIIENIEENNFASDQVATFTRGYLRSYARAVGLEESVVLCALDGCEETKPEEQEMKSFSRKTNREKHDSRIMTLTWGIFAVIAGISSVWWWQNQETSMVDLISETEQERQIEQLQASEPELDFTTLEAPESPVTATDSNIEEIIEAEAAQTTEPSISTEIIAESVEAQAKETAAIEVSQPEPVAEITEPQEQDKPVEVVKNLLTMSFSDDCWIQVKDSSGKTLSTGVKKAGQSLELSGNMPYSVILGAPENVSMTLASEPVDLSGYTSGKVARFNLP
ncbi:cytoskeleton protein RodZ [Vibrio aquaticus]|uniref:Cytoskeleton protein RodZ n=1 Tax=Vibrio aquaticus TaxID=2496559 RepID=A0A3S0QCQ9_9VIBR|nr:cytoskeleton protein RodZ [Vibrio aquaticus]RTZ15296.1 cytoskeleton protein RodZ [Vibrio aquaticus]